MRKDGTTINVECHGSRMDESTDGANKPVLISSVLDITERVTAERELGAIQAQLRDQATHDALTGLYNRRYLEDTLSQELIRAERAGRTVSLIMADIDHFKAVNDVHGHIAGDDVLREMGTLLRGSARASDTYCRYGGEEFILLLPEMAEPDAIGTRRADPSQPRTHGHQHQRYPNLGDRIVRHRRVPPARPRPRRTDQGRRRRNVRSEAGRP